MKQSRFKLNILWMLLLVGLFNLWTTELPHGLAIINILIVTGCAFIIGHSIGVRNKND